jgi:glycosyltransferase involved in cell wall biosynthesis
VRVLVDYRPALRERTGVGEYVHQFVRALLAGFSRQDLDIALFSSSWKDRLEPSGELSGATAVDRRVPGKLLNFAWHRLGWPPAELIAGHSFDVVHSLHPLLLPAQDAAQVITIHDLDFLAHPERTRAEIRRDYPALARDHAHRADAIVTISHSTARAVEREFGVPADRITVCTPGAPAWEPRRQAPKDGYVLFMGTLEPRKNVGGLLDAYEQLVNRRRDVPRLIIAGKALAEATPWLERIARAPLKGYVEHVGYVEAPNRRALYEGARLVVQPSFDEGFGIPVLEAMACGSPVVTSRATAMEEVAAGAAVLVDPNDPAELAAGIERASAQRAELVPRGLERAREFRWDAVADATVAVYREAAA